MRGFAEDGLALARADLVPEVTITAEGVYWHPIGAEDSDLMVRSEIFPLAESFEAVRLAFERESEHQRRLAQNLQLRVRRTRAVPGSKRAAGEEALLFRRDAQ